MIRHWSVAATVALLAALFGTVGASAKCQHATNSASAENYKEKEAQAHEDAVSLNPGNGSSSRDERGLAARG
jgi:hypothetical protein